MQKDYRTCSFWATKLKNNRKNGAGDGKFEENQHSNENFKELAECILVEARNQQVRNLKNILFAFKNYFKKDDENL